MLVRFDVSFNSVTLLRKAWVICPAPTEAKWSVMQTDPNLTIKVLRLLEHATLSELTDAVDYALSIGAKSVDAVESILCDQSQLRATVRCLLDEANDAVDERRGERRESFFSPVSITLEGQRQVSCFSRDISRRGIGLLHYMAVELGEVVLTIPSKSWGPIRIRAQIRWCRPCGEGWYLSGARFLEVLSSAAQRHSVE